MSALLPKADIGTGMSAQDRFQNCCGSDMPGSTFYISLWLPSHSRVSFEALLSLMPAECAVCGIVRRVLWDSGARFARLFVAAWARFCWYYCWYPCIQSSEFLQ